MEILERKNGVAVGIVNFSKLFEEVGDRAIIVNHFDLTRVEEKERLNRLLYTHYEGNVLSVVPSCNCGHTTKESNVGVICEECSTPVTRVTERPLMSMAWIAPPSGVGPFLNPQIWTILSSAMTMTGFNVLEWLCNPMVAMPAEPNRFLRRVIQLTQEMRLPQGINHFAERFDEILIRFYEQGLLYPSGTKRQRQDLMQFIREFRDCVFTPALPIPSKLSFITERTATRTYADKTMYPMMDAILTITATENSATPLHPRVKQGRAVKANMLVSKFYQDFIGTVLARKQGVLRKQVMGSRLHFTFRAVISPLHTRHHRSELHLPWSMAVKVFDLHLTSKLYARGFSVNEASAYLAEHVLKYSELLGELFEEMIVESRMMNAFRPQGAPEVLGIPVLLNRNPTLMRGSIQRMYVTQINPNPRETSIKMSVISLAAP
jgi:hypothetical protein